MDAKKLQVYFNFDEADLEANRKGRLTEKQKKRFKMQDNSKGRDNLAMGLVFLVVAGLGLFVGVIAAIQGPDLISKIAFGACFGVFWPFVWGAIGWNMLKPTRRRPSNNPRVKAERGPLKLVRHEPQDGVPYLEIKVGSHSVETDADLSDVVAEGEEYALYYLQKTNEVVSLERVSKPKR
jgi:hypothetical protein